MTSAKLLETGGSVPPGTAVVVVGAATGGCGAVTGTVMGAAVVGLGVTGMTGAPGLAVMVTTGGQVMKEPGTGTGAAVVSISVM